MSCFNTALISKNKLINNNDKAINNNMQEHSTIKERGSQFPIN